MSQNAANDSAKLARQGWVQVSFVADCEGGCEASGELGDICSLCGGEYASCGCPGPTMDGYEYQELDGVLWARRTDKND